MFFDNHQNGKTVSLTTLPEVSNVGMITIILTKNSIEISWDLQCIKLGLKSGDDYHSLLPFQPLITLWTSIDHHFEHGQNSEPGAPPRDFSHESCS